MDAFRNACDAIGLVGRRLRADLANQIKAALVARQGKDVIRLTGPTGSGKELVSSLIHETSRTTLGRRGKLVVLSCSTLPPGHLDVTLFGGSGAPGLLRQARQGTLVLDEVQALGLEDQAKLLRLLGEREFLPVGATRVEKSDALFVLSSSADLAGLASEGAFRRDLLDRALAKIHLPPLWKRREDIRELAEAFAEEAANERGWEPFDGFTRRALADIEGAVVEARETSVRRLREMVRDLIFSLDEPVEVIESSALEPHLKAFFGLDHLDRARWDAEAIDDGFDLVVEGRTVERLASLHGIPEHTLVRLTKILREVYEALPSGKNPVPGSYRNLVARMGMATKAALWLMSGATNQAEFRRFFGSKPFEMPPKSVAWQIYHDLFGEEGRAGE